MVDKKTLVRIIVGIKRVDKRRMYEMGVEVEVTESAKKLARGIWAAHVERMGDGKLAKRTDAQKVEGK